MYVRIPIQTMTGLGGVVLTVAVAAIFHLGFNHSSAPAVSAAAGQQSVSPSGSTWVSYIDANGTTRMACATGLMTLGVPVERRLPRPRAGTFSAAADTAADGSQTDVRLAIDKTPSPVMALIVHVSGPDRAGRGNDTEVGISVGTGGSQDELVDTASRVFQGRNGQYRITSLELCLAPIA